MSTSSSAPRAGKRQYHAMTSVLDKRLFRSWWGGRYSYTWSQLKDNQFGEDSTYQARTAVPQNVYDVDAEYSISNFDSPHRIVLAPIVRFPNPSSSFRLLTGWSLSAVVELVSGSPLKCRISAGESDSNLGLFGRRQRPNHRRSEYARRRRGSRVVGRSSGCAMVQRRRIPESRFGSVRGCAADNRGCTLPLPKEPGSGDYEGHALRVEPVRPNPSGAAEPDQHSQIQRRLGRNGGGSEQLRPHHVAPRLHADLAAQFQVRILTDAGEVRRARAYALACHVRRGTC